MKIIFTIAALALLSGCVSDSQNSNCENYLGNWLGAPKVSCERAVQNNRTASPVPVSGKTSPIKL